MSRPGGTLWDFLIKTRRFETSSRSRDVRAIRVVYSGRDNIASRISFFLPRTHIRRLLAPSFLSLTRPVDFGELVWVGQKGGRINASHVQGVATCVRAMMKLIVGDPGSSWYTGRFRKQRWRGHHKGEGLEENKLDEYQTGRVRMSLVRSSISHKCISVHRSTRSHLNMTFAGIEY